MTLQGPPFSRDQDLACAMRCIASANCCAVVGVSNTGKSVLLRALSTPDVRRHYLKSQAEDYALIYVDCNLMVELTEQGFYELVLRSALTELRALSASPDLADRIGNLYRQVVDSTNPFLVPLGFNESIIALSEGLDRRVVFLFDEFDEPLLNIDERVFLNLRALKDRYGDRLAYVTATEARLGKMRSGEAVSEFAELFAHNTLFLTMLSETDTHRLVAQLMSEANVEVSPEDQAFVREQAGGHPGLTIAACRVLAELGGGASGLSALSHRLAREHLDNDPNVQNECIKLWNDLTGPEREALLSLITHPRKTLPRAEKRSLTRKGIVSQTGPSLQLFGRLFEGYVRRQKLLTGHAEGRHIVMAGIKDLYPMVASVGHVEIVTVVHGNVPRRVKVGIVRSRFTRHANRSAVRAAAVKHLDAVIASVTDIDITSAVEGDAAWPVKVLVVRSRFPRLSQLCQIVTVRVVLDHTGWRAVHHPDVAVTIHSNIGDAAKVCVIGSADQARRADGHHMRTGGGILYRPCASYLSDP